MSTAFPEHGPSSLASAAERKLLGQLQAFVEGESQKSVFAVGGSIPISNDSEINHEPVAGDESIISHEIPSPDDTDDDSNISYGSVVDDESVVGDESVISNDVSEQADTEVDPHPQINDNDAYSNNSADEATDIHDKVTAKPEHTIESENSLCSPPVVIRWDRDQEEVAISNNVVGRAQFPAADPHETSSLSHLVQSCQPAKFGRGHVDVLDESYRKAGKLDSSRFSTNFNPYEFGIIDSIAKMLLPSVLGGPNAKLACSRAIRAELYKLNVYSAPSGKFKAHVDTPRSTAQFGSLVVCLPSPHQGGQLVVRHHGEEIVFDWSRTDADSSASTIEWAAFYSDCEHEVLEVTKGHRITLTYNLYVVSRGIPSGISSMNPEMLPMAQMMKDMLAQPGFLSKGAILGFNCTHAYAHANQARVTNGDIHSSLKGIDMAVYVALRAAGLEVHLRPVVDDKDDYGCHDGKYEDFDSWIEGVTNQPNIGKWLDKWGSIYEWIDRDGKVLRDWNAEVWQRRKYRRSDRNEFVTITDTAEEIADRVKKLECYRLYLKSQKATLVGKKLWPWVMSETTIGEGPTIVEVLDDWNPHRKYSYSREKSRVNENQHMDPAFNGFHEFMTKPKWAKDANVPYDFVHVQWLNEPIHREPAISYTVYGNESSPAMMYSRLAILTRIPPFLERKDSNSNGGRHVEWSDIGAAATH